MGNTALGSPLAARDTVPTPQSSAKYLDTKTGSDQVTGAQGPRDQIRLSKLNVHFPLVTGLQSLDPCPVLFSVLHSQMALTHPHSMGPPPHLIHLPF